jgi:hypothetical protein
MSNEQIEKSKPVDCNSYCDFLGYYPIEERGFIAKINLSAPVFRIEFDYNIERWDLGETKGLYLGV